MAGTSEEAGQWVAEVALLAIQGTHRLNNIAFLSKRQISKWKRPFPNDSNNSPGVSAFATLEIADDKQLSSAMRMAHSSALVKSCWRAQEICVIRAKTIGTLTGANQKARGGTPGTALNTVDLQAFSATGLGFGVASLERHQNLKVRPLA